ncbi:MAG: peroxiredoxin [Cyclobacteriaceae bacterium]|nr:MAG: peroxiredoxin [Cyclobacteriaceae bacterium]
MTHLKPGEKAPDFSAPDQDGKKVSLSDFKGRKLVLYFYPRDMTSGCTAEACNLRDNYTALQKKGYEIVGVSTDSAESHRKFITKEKLPFRLLADTDKSVHLKYGTWVEKSLYGRKYMGTARVTFVIDENGIIEDVIEKVDTRNHAAQILKQGEKKAALSGKAGNRKTAATGTRKKGAVKKAVGKTGSRKK